MRVRHLTKFEDDGTRCSRDISELRRRPDCGIFFIQDKPFQAHKKFTPIDRTFSIKVLDTTIPRDPNIPRPPPFGSPEQVDIGIRLPPFGKEYLPQDYTNHQQAGRRLVGELLEYNRTGGYARIPLSTYETDLPFPTPKIGNDSYSHQTQEPKRPVGGDVELTNVEDFGAGVGIPNQEPQPISRTSREPLADPRDTEFKPRGMANEDINNARIDQLTRNSTQSDAALMQKQLVRQARRMTLPKPRIPQPVIEGTELVAIEPEAEEALIVREAERFTYEDRPTISQRQAEQIAKHFQDEKGISRQRTLEILEEFGLYDTQFEFEIGQIADPNQREFQRRVRALRIRQERLRAQRDTNLLPATEPDTVSARPDTPLTRGRTDIAAGRGRIEKAMDRIAGRLPEEARQIYKSAQRSATRFNENVRTRALEAVTSIRATTARTFGQHYESITTRPAGGIELTTPDGNISVRPPATDLPPASEIREALNADPLNTASESFTGDTRPRLSYAERLQRVRAGALSRETGVAGAGAVGGVLVGFGVAELMGQAGVHNQYAIAAGAGGAGGAAARILTMAGSRALTRSAATTAATTAGTRVAAEEAAILGGTSILRAGAEGAAVGLALMPLDALLNQHFVNAGMSHTGANLASGAFVGGLGTAATTIGLASLGAAPETLGASLVVGGLAMAATSIIGFFTGQHQDREEERARQQIENERNRLNGVSAARQRLLATLPENKYNFSQALGAFNDQASLGIHDETWDQFSTAALRMFSLDPAGFQASRYNAPTQRRPQAPSPPLTGDALTINNLYNKYITHELINRVCTGGASCNDLRTHDQGALTSSEIQFLNEHSGNTWQNQANMQVEMSYQEANATHNLISMAQTQMIDAWNTDQRIASDLDPYIVQSANLDPTFRHRYETAIQLDAQQRVVDAYQHNQTRLDNLPKNIRETAIADPHFNTMIHQYYNTMETTAGQLQVSVPQLIELQGLSGDAQRDRYQNIQFDNIKQDPIVVRQAQEIARQEDQVRQAGFYDLDQAYLESDPTHVSSWHPTDSQILQAHAAGMNLNEYTAYMHQLSRGQAGDYSKLPQYSDQEQRASGLLDYSHFQDELQMAGYRSDMYLYDAETRQFTLNPNVTNSQIPETENAFVSRYTPQRLLEARNQYNQAVIGLNQQEQNRVDNYNNNLMRELSAYGRHYDQMVADYNDELLYQGRSDLLFYDVQSIYDQNKLELNPHNQQLRGIESVDGVTSRAEATRRQLDPTSRAQAKQIAADKYGISVPQYNQVKQTMSDKGIVNATQQQVNEHVEQVRNQPQETKAVSQPVS